jgi:hypothetical protein
MNWVMSLALNRPMRKLTDGLIGLGLIAVFAAPFVFGAFAVLDWLKAQRAETATLEDRYDRVRAIAAFDPSALERGDATALTAAYVLGDGAPSLETSALQARLREMAGTQGLQILQASELQFEVSDAPIEKLGVRLELSGPSQGVLRFLDQIERATPWLFLDGVQLRSGYADGVEVAAEPPLSLGLDVWGVRVKQKTGAENAP